VSIAKKCFAATASACEVLRQAAVQLFDRELPKEDKDKFSKMFVLIIVGFLLQKPQRPEKQINPLTFFVPHFHPQ